LIENSKGVVLSLSSEEKEDTRASIASMLALCITILLYYSLKPITGLFYSLFIKIIIAKGRHWGHFLSDLINKL